LQPAACGLGRTFRYALHLAVGIEPKRHQRPIIRKFVKAMEYLGAIRSTMESIERRAPDAGRRTPDAGKSCAPY